MIPSVLILAAGLLACGGTPETSPEAAEPAAATAAPDDARGERPANAVRSESGRVAEIDIATLKQRVDAGETFVLDVRTPQEFAEGHVPGAVNIPVQELNDRLDELSEYKDKDIDVVCRSGSRSITATRTLRGSGFARATNVQGGTMAWIQAGYPTE